MALTIDLKVVPSAGKQAWKLDKAGRLVCYLKSAPERGLANRELIHLLAKALKVPQAAIKIVMGKTSRKKRMSIAQEISQAQLYAALGFSFSDDKQLMLFGS